MIGRDNREGSREVIVGLVGLERDAAEVITLDGKRVDSGGDGGMGGVSPVIIKVGGLGCDEETADLLAIQKNARVGAVVAGVKVPALVELGVVNVERVVGGDEGGVGVGAGAGGYDDLVGPAGRLVGDEVGIEGGVDDERAGVGVVGLVAFGDGLAVIEGDADRVGSDAEAAQVDVLVVIVEGLTGIDRATGVVGEFDAVDEGLGREVSGGLISLIDDSGVDEEGALAGEIGGVGEVSGGSCPPSRRVG